MKHNKAQQKKKKKEKKRIVNGLARPFKPDTSIYNEYLHLAIRKYL